jgi:hypothetical protein
MSNDSTPDPEFEEDVGRATIVYEDPAEGTVERTVANEHIAYFQDHWMIKIEEDEQGRDRVRRVPAYKVHYVERTVDEFAEEVGTLKGEIGSVASDLQEKLPIGGEGDSDADGDEDPGEGSVHIDVTDGDPDDPDDRR